MLRKRNILKFTLAYDIIKMRSGIEYMLYEKSLHARFFFLAYNRYYILNRKITKNMEMTFRIIFFPSQPPTKLNNKSLNTNVNGRRKSYQCCNHNNFM